MNTRNLSKYVFQNTKRCVCFPAAPKCFISSSSKNNKAEAVNVSRKKWQSPTTVQRSIVEEEDVYHTCMTLEEFHEDHRVNFMRPNPELEKYDANLGPETKHSLLSLIPRPKSLTTDNINLVRSVMRADSEYLTMRIDSKYNEKLVADQSLNAAQLQLLGPDLYAAQFLLYRKARVRMHGVEGFYQISLSQKSPLPENKCVPGWYIRDVDISDMRIMYEGLENFEGCMRIEGFIMRNNQYVDTWYVDRICAQHYQSLKRVDLSYCKKMTVGAVSALARCPLLEEVTLEGMEIEPVELRMACLDLLDIFPNLKIHGLDLFLEEEEMKKSSE